MNQTPYTPDETNDSPQQGRLVDEILEAEAMRNYGSTYPCRAIRYTHDGVTRHLFGGSFFRAPEGDDFVTINLMAEEPGLPSDLYLPIRDFSIPTETAGFVQAFEEILQSGMNAYVGCHGGIGRTGLFMGCFLRYLGYDNPLEMVRGQYHGHAVETNEQMDFLDAFPTKASLTPPPARPKTF